VFELLSTSLANVLHHRETSVSGTPSEFSGPIMRVQSLLPGCVKGVTMWKWRYAFVRSRLLTLSDSANVIFLATSNAGGNAPVWRNGPA
jgi:hypothetical protein